MLKEIYMKKNFQDIMQCPLCDSRKFEDLISLDIPYFDKSFLYKHIRLTSCNKCGHIYNKLLKNEQKNYLNYYHEADAFSSKITKDYVLKKRTNDLFKILKKHCNSSSEILDLGSGDGYMLNSLYNKGYKNLSGIDILVKKNKPKYYNYKSGNIDKLPYKSNLFDLVVLEQIFEHTINPKKALQEAFRVAKLNGKIILGIPNAAKYAKSKLFPLYMIMLREHIQHFDIHHINQLAEDLGVVMLESKETIYPLQTMNMPMHNIYIVLQKRKIKKKSINKFLLKSSMKKYIKKSNEKLNTIIEKISKFEGMDKTIYFWGIGREFFLIYSMLEYKKNQNIKFIDSNKRKHKKKIGGMRIYDKNYLKKINQNNAVIVVTAVFHFSEIQVYLKSINFTGDVVKIF